MNVLSIGNSFSHDPQAYLHQIAAADDVELDCFNLFMGGNLLANAYRNSLSDERAFTLEMNGMQVGFCVSLKEALLNRTWEVITLQQTSIDSVNYSSYQPYLNRLVEFIRLCSPKSKIALQQTWAYRQDNPCITGELRLESRERMFDAICDAYGMATEEIGPDILIPSGELVEMLIKADVGELYRDELHLSRGVGRYALGLLWYTMLTKRPIDTNTFCAFREPIDGERIAAIKQCVRAVADKYAEL